MSAQRTKTAHRKHSNILLIAIDSLRRDHMSCYGYPKLTTPHIDLFAQDGVLFENTISAHIPTTSAYASMLTGRDCFGTGVVALRHKGGLARALRTLPEILRKAGYNTTCIGFTGNPSSRGFSRYLDYAEAWGSWTERPSHKAGELNKVAIPEIERLNRSPKPWLLMLRHMDPHAPYLPPPPFDVMFYHGDPCDPKNRTMEPVMAFRPFRDFFTSWMPPGITDKDHVIAQYDGAVAYMDACIQVIFNQLKTMGVLEETIVVLNGDHGETLYDHECWFDHHGLYEPTLVVPLIIRYPEKLPREARIPGYNQHKDLVPTLIELAGVETDVGFDGRSLTGLVQGRRSSHESEFYITECTWMRKHGWRTPHWKLIVALEPDFHFKSPVELYNLVEDPEELRNVAGEYPDIAAHLEGRMKVFIARRERETGITNPMLTQGDWHGKEGIGAFKTSQQAYDTLHIASAKEGKRLQAKGRG